MTTVGKLLVFLVLVFGIGCAVFATAVYSQRPAWFDPAAEGGAAKGADPNSFAQLTAEIDRLGKAATAANATWGTQLRALQKAEKTRADRRTKMFGPTGYLASARKGSAPAKAGAEPGPGFFQFKEDESTRLLDLDARGAPVVGPDGLPLRGAETLLDRFNTDVAATEDLSKQAVQLRADQKRLGGEVLLSEAQLTEQRNIRESLRDEAAYLASLEVNVAEQRSTAVQRRGQLLRRLAVFGPSKAAGGEPGRAGQPD